MKQFSFWKNPRPHHGGAQAQGKRKCARPLTTKNPMHVVLKSSRARGEWSFLRHAGVVEGKVRATAKKFEIRVLRYQNVGNHLHLAIQGRRRRDLQNFFRVVAQAIAYSVTGARRGKPVGKFWDALVFTRIVQWGRDWRNLGTYFEKNFWEAKGMPRDVVDLWFEIGKTPIG